MGFQVKEKHHLMIMLAGTAGTERGWKQRHQSGGRCNHLAGDGTGEVETGVVQMQRRGQILDLFPSLTPNFLIS